MSKPFQNKKIFCKLGQKWNFVSLIKASIKKKPTVNILFNDEILNTFALRLR